MVSANEAGGSALCLGPYSKSQISDPRHTHHMTVIVLARLRSNVEHTNLKWTSGGLFNRRERQQTRRVFDLELILTSQSYCFPRYQGYRSLSSPVLCDRDCGPLPASNWPWIAIGHSDRA
jgi:hypothetical protein